MGKNSGKIWLYIICLVALQTGNSQVVAAKNPYGEIEKLENCTVEKGEGLTYGEAVEVDEQTARDILDMLEGVENAQNAESFLDELDKLTESIVDNGEKAKTIEIPIVQDLLNWLTGMITQVFGFVETFINETLS